MKPALSALLVALAAFGAVFTGAGTAQAYGYPFPVYAGSFEPAAGAVVPPPSGLSGPAVLVAAIAKGQTLALTNNQALVVHWFYCQGTDIPPAMPAPSYTGSCRILRSAAGGTSTAALIPSNLGTLFAPGSVVSYANSSKANPGFIFFRTWTP